MQLKNGFKILYTKDGKWYAGKNRLPSAEDTEATLAAVDGTILFGETAVANSDDDVVVTLEDFEAEEIAAYVKAHQNITIHFDHDDPRSCHTEGYEDGYAEGKADGEALHADDFNNGKAAGEALHENDYDNGKAAGEALHADDYNNGYAAGEEAHAGDFDEGKAAGEALHENDYDNGKAVGVEEGKEEGKSYAISNITVEDGYTLADQQLTIGLSLDTEHVLDVCADFSSIASADENNELRNYLITETGYYDDEAYTAGRDSVSVNNASFNSDSGVSVSLYDANDNELSTATFAIDDVSGLADYMENVRTDEYRSGREAGRSDISVNSASIDYYTGLTVELYADSRSYDSCQISSIDNIESYNSYVESEFLNTITVELNSAYSDALDLIIKNENGHEDKETSIAFADIADGSGAADLRDYLIEATGYTPDTSSYTLTNLTVDQTSEPLQFIAECSDGNDTFELRLDCNDEIANNLTRYNSEFVIWPIQDSADNTITVNGNTAYLTAGGYEFSASADELITSVLNEYFTASDCTIDYLAGDSSMTINVSSSSNQYTYSWQRSIPEDLVPNLTVNNADISNGELTVSIYNHDNFATDSTIALDNVSGLSDYVDEAKQESYEEGFSSGAGAVEVTWLNYSVGNKQFEIYYGAKTNAQGEEDGSDVRVHSIDISEADFLSDLIGPELGTAIKNGYYAAGRLDVTFNKDTDAEFTAPVYFTDLTGFAGCDEFQDSVVNNAMADPHTRINYLTGDADSVTVDMDGNLSVEVSTQEIRDLEDRDEMYDYTYQSVPIDQIIEGDKENHYLVKTLVNAILADDSDPENKASILADLRALINE